MRSHTLLPLVLPLFCAAAHGAPDVLNVEPDRDNTLYETTDGSLSNGAGDHLFAGATQSGFKRRALVRFDLSAIPQGAWIRNVELDAYVSKVPLLAPSSSVQVHRVTSDWGEGLSDAQGEEGGGAPSEPGDATWIHTFYSSDLWTAAGGDHHAAASAQVVIPGQTGPVQWTGPGLVADVQRWVRDPATNLGWLIRAEDEFDPGNSKRFDSRENPDPTRRMHLFVEWEMVPPDAPAERACVPLTFCDGHPANTAVLATSTCACGGGSIVLTLGGAPPGQLAYLLAGTGTGTLTDPPGAQGDLCLGGAPIARFSLDVGTIDGSGAFATDILQATSGGGGGAVPNLGGNFCVPAGQTWSFQYWYRDGSTSRFSRAVRVTLQP